MIKDHTDLIVWRKAMTLVEEVYKASREFPKEEVYGLRSQLRRAAVSIPANIAEGHGRKSTKEYAHHISIAYGSLMEVETHVEIAFRLGYIDEAKSKGIREMSSEVGRLLNGLAKSLSS